LLKFLIHLCQSKGFSCIYLHAQSQLKGFYEGYGFSQIREPFGFSDHTYFEMKASLPLVNQSFGLEQGPHILNRPEGTWHTPGVLEASVDRMSPSPILCQDESDIAA
jgi:hypothetical protein